MVMFTEVCTGGCGHRGSYSILDTRLDINIWKEEANCLNLTNSRRLPGMSENMRIHSLKSKVKRSSFKCCRMLTPTKRGNEQLPSNRVSQR